MLDGANVGRDFALVHADAVRSLILVGDRDIPCLEPSLMLRDWTPHAGLAVFPACGHTPNLEEPGLFNLHVAEFLAAVEGGRWAGWSRWVGVRSPRPE